MSFVVTLVGYIPSPRYDGVPWTQAQIGFATTQAGPFSTIDTIALSPLDPDPRFPSTRNLTTAKSPAATGWFLVTFLDAAGNQEPTNAVQFPAAIPGGASSPTQLSARYAVRHRIRDGVPLLDANPVPYNMVRLEELTDQLGTPPPATPTQTVFQVRYADVPTVRYMNAQVCPGTLVAYVDGSWAATLPTVDVNSDGNFTLPVPPVSRLLISYAYQYLSDGEIDQFVDEARQWLREFQTVGAVPDGLVPALVSYASFRALTAIQRSATLAPVKAGDSDVDWSKLATSYQSAANAAYTTASKEREVFYTQGPEAMDPTVIDVSALGIDPYTPLF